MTSPTPARRATLLWWAGAAGIGVAVGLVLVLVLILLGRLWSADRPLAPAGATRTQAQPGPTALCPPPTAPPPTAPPPTAPYASPRSGPRTVDDVAGISYLAYGAPWERWSTLWSAGALRVPYKVGQHFVTESYPGGSYHATILSAALNVAVNDSTGIDLECTGRQVAADARTAYYPQPNTMELLREQRTVLGGRAAWVTKFRLHFDEPGLTVRDELVSVALVDLGRPAVAVLFVSIPGTHPQWSRAVDEVIASVRPF
jgi:hypothetical protein